MWVELKYTPVDVQLEEDGSLTVSTTEGHIEIADEAAVYGCWNCNTPLDTDTFGTDCVGADADSENIAKNN